MSHWIVLPYDRSPVARAALRRAARIARGQSADHAGVMLAVAGIDPFALAPVIEEAQAIAGQDLPLEVSLLTAGDPLAAFRRLMDTMPGATLAAPIAAQGRAPWYAVAVDYVLRGGAQGTIALYIEPQDVAEFEETSHERHSVGGVVGAVLRAGARLRLGVRAPVRGGAR